MVKKIIHFSIHNKLIVGLLVIGMALSGIYSFIKLPIDALPDVTSNQVQIITQSPALAASEVEKFVTYPLELSLRTIPNTEEIRSMSRMGLSIITVVFEDDVSLQYARQQVDEKIKLAENSLIKGSGKPEMAPITTGLGEFYQYTLEVEEAYKDRYSLTDLRTIQDWIIKRQLLGINGVVEISSFGGFVKQYEVSINPKNLINYGIDISEVIDALDKNNSNSGGSYIERSTNAYFIRTEGMVQSLEDIEKIVVRPPKIGGIPLLIKDLGTVSIGHAVRYGAMVRNGEGETVGGVMLLLKNANASEVVDNLKNRIEQIQSNLPKGIKIVPYLDRSVLIGKSFSTVQKNLIEGSLIVIFILVVLLGNFRAGLIVASTIPLALLFTFSLMKIFNVSANLMSLGAIDFGLIVDGSVIIVESILHRFQKLKNAGNLNFEEELEKAATSVFKSAAMGVFIILIVYFPIMSLGGIEGKMFRPMAETVSFAIIGSMILSLTYIPMISAVFLKNQKFNKITLADRIIEKLYAGFSPILSFSIKKPLLMIFLSIILFLISIWRFGNMGGEFIPELNEGDFAVETLLPTDASLSQSIEMNNEAQKFLLKEFPDEIISITSRIGASEIPTDPMGINNCDLIIQLTDPDQWKKAKSYEELAQKMDEALNVFPNINFEFTQPIQMRFNELIGGSKSDIAIKIFGEDLTILFNEASSFAKKIASVEGIGDLKVQQIDGIPQIFIIPNRDKLAQFGVTIDEINLYTRAAFAGENIGSVLEGEKRFDLTVRLDKNYRQNIEDIKSLAIPLKNGGTVPFSTLAKIEYQSAPVEISRDNAKRRITIGINVRNRDLQSVVEDIRNIQKSELVLPSGYFIEYGGTFENLNAAKERLMIVVPLALILIFILLFLTFQSLLDASIIYLAIPLSAIGGIWSLSLREMPFSISAGIGFIALFGVAVLNGIVLISNFKELKSSTNLSIKEIVFKGVETRFRPVLLTALVASFGFLPMAVSISPGAEVQKPLATVVIGGLITATILTLVILPTVYYFIYSKKKLLVSKTSLIILFTFISFSVFSQSKPQLSLNECVQIAKKENPWIKQGDLTYQAALELIGSGKEFGKTAIDYQFGKIQLPQMNDYFVSIGQTIPWPGLIKKQIEFLESQSDIELNNQKIIQTMVISAVRNYYTQLTIQNKLLDYYTIQRDIYKASMEAAKKSFEMGSSGKLPFISLEANFKEFEVKINRLNKDIEIGYQTLKFWMNDTRDFEIEEIANLEESFVYNTSIYSNPGLKVLESELNSKKLTVEIEKQKLKPDFKIGIINQSIEGTKNQPAILAGINIPLFKGAQKARIQSAQKAYESKEIELEYKKSNLELNHSTLLKELIKSNQSIDYYEETGLSHAELLENNGLLSFKIGEISYLEFAQLSNQAWKIREAYLNELQNKNKLLIELETLVGYEE